MSTDDTRVIVTSTAEGMLHVRAGYINITLVYRSTYYSAREPE